MPRFHPRTEHGDESLDRAMASVGEDLVVASNRQPYRHEFTDDGERIDVDRPKGGLTEGLDAVMRQLHGTWIAWGDGDADGAVVDPDGRVTVPPEAGSGQYELSRVWLSDEQVQNYYYGFSNRVLWPIMHSALTAVDAEPEFWGYYRDVNELFAEQISEATSEGAVVWFQDYHFALAPRLVDAWLPGNAFLAHTWHVPWPSWDVFRACPHNEEILRGLLGNDLLTFHVQRYCDNFLRCAAAALPDAHVEWDANRVVHDEGTTTVRAFPMGVPAERINREARTQQAERFWSRFAAEHGLGDGVRTAVGVDRLDYSKGIPERIAALEHLWERQPRWRESLTYVQVGTESRSEIPAYSRYQTQVEDAVQRVNDRFGTEHWTPIVYTTAMLDDEELAGLYRHADLGLVSPVRDGMNLVAQEYVAAQQDDDGVLVLSDQAGAHDEIGDSVVSVSPFDLHDFAASIDDALTMPPGQRRARMHALRRYVASNDITTWVGEVLNEIEALRRPRQRRSSSASA